jgi:hypothetical protein
MSVAAETLLARAAALWAPILAPLPPSAEAVLTAAVLSLLRWSPAVLRETDSPTWRALLAAITGRHLPADKHPPRVHQSTEAAGRLDKPFSSPLHDADRAQDGAKASGPSRDIVPVSSHAAPAAALQPHGRVLMTGWGGVLFLVNALHRLDVETLLAAMGDAAPTGWRVLHDLAVAFGMPEEEPLALFLAEQDLDLDTEVPRDLLATLLDGIEALYRADGPWPLPLAQTARLRATETHLDLDLATPTVDLALRLSGLDLDPGWVPWLGRVLTFHYDAVPTHYRRSG